jgi:hypothetical protein
MEKSNMKKIVLFIITVIIIATCIVIISINISGKDTNINNSIKNEIQQEEMPQEPEYNNMEEKEPSSSKQVGL